MEEKKEIELQILKTASNYNTVLFVALVPNEIDRNGDIIIDSEIVNTAHNFVKELGKKYVNIDHEEGTKVKNAEFVESFIAPVEIPVGLEVIPVGAWVVGIQFDEETYNAVVDGEFVGISIEGTGTVEEILKG